MKREKNSRSDTPYLKKIIIRRRKEKSEISSTWFSEPTSRNESGEDAIFDLRENLLLNFDAAEETPVSIFR